MTWEMTLQERYEDGVEAGRREGRNQGIEENLCSLIQKKLEKGKSLEQIADECEETEERILQLMEKLQNANRLENK